VYIFSVMKTPRSLTYSHRHSSSKEKCFYVEARPAEPEVGFTSRQITIAYAENLASYLTSKGFEARMTRCFDIAMLFVARKRTSRWHNRQWAAR
jgi:hypothetical protein